MTNKKLMIGDRAVVTYTKAPRWGETGVVWNVVKGELVVRFEDNALIVYAPFELSTEREAAAMWDAPDEGGEVIDDESYGDEGFGDEDVWNETVDMVHQPPHYAGLRVEPKRFIVPNEFEFCIGNIVKYASRAGRKLYPGLTAAESEIKDLEKAIEYAEMRIDFLAEMQHDAD